MTTTTPTEAAERVAEFVRQHQLASNLDPDVIYTVCIGPDAEEAPLLASDLLALVAAAQAPNPIHAKLAESGIDRLRLDRAIAGPENWGHLVHAFEIVATLAAVQDAWQEADR